MKNLFDENRITQIKVLIEWFVKQKSLLFENFVTEDETKIFKILHKGEEIRISFCLPNLELREADALKNDGFDFGLRDKDGLWGGAVDASGVVIQLYYMGKAGNLGQGFGEHKTVVYKEK